MINFGSSEKLPKKFLQNSIPDIWVWENNLIRTFVYENQKTVVPPITIGHQYHIIIFRRFLDFRNDKLVDDENFKCYLLEPPYYISGLIENKYAGLVVREYEKSEGEFATFFENYKKSYKKKSLHKFFLEQINGTNIREVKN